MGEMATQRRGGEGKANGAPVLEEKTSDLMEERKRRRKTCTLGHKGYKVDIGPAGSRAM